MSSAGFPNSLIVEASRAISRYAAHQRVLEAMALRLPLNQVLSRLVQSIEDASPGSRCAIMLVNDAGTHLTTGAAPNLPDAYNRAVNGAPIAPDGGSCGTAIWRKQRVIVADIERDPLWAQYRAYALPYGLRASWSTPIIAANGVALGGISVYYSLVREPAAAELSIVDDAVDLACVAIGQARAETAVLRSEAHYRAVVETAPSPIVGLDQYEAVNEWNRAAEQLFGRDRAAILGQHFSRTCLTADARVTFERCFDQSHAHHIQLSCETEILRPDGSTRWVLWSMSPIVTNSNGVDGLLAIAQDITARMEAEEALRRSEHQLRHSQKMEAVGRLAGGIAHDFNNLLTVIQGNAVLALHDAATDTPQHVALSEVCDAATRASALTRQLLAFSRREPVEPTVLDLNAIVDNLRRMLGRLIGEHIQLDTDLATAAMTVVADRTNVEQLLINLVVNARDAMPEGGVLTVATQHVTLADEAAEDLELAAGSYVQLTVSDTGVGMDEHTRGRAFEPFFTTKPSGEGTGIGLATVYAIASRHQGAVDIESLPSIGTTVTLWLPAVDGVAASAQENGDHAAQTSGSGTVLLVEDEEAVRHLARRILVAQGYRVLEAANGEEAVQLWPQVSAEVDVVVTDVVMPRMGGQALVDRLRADRPDLAVVFCSGYSDNLLMPITPDDPRTAFLAKPFTSNGLVERVARLVPVVGQLRHGSHSSSRVEP